MSSSHFLEIVKIESLSKKVVVDYQIEELNHTIFGNKFKTNKWVSFQDWLEVYEKIQSILSPPLSTEQSSSQDNILENFSSEYIITNNNVKVTIEKGILTSSIARIFEVDKKALHKEILRVHIKHVKPDKRKNIESVPTYKSSPKINKKIIKEIATNEYNPDNIEPTHVPYEPKITIIEDSQNNEENSTVPYTPSESIDTTEIDKEPYSPKPLTLPCTPTKTISPDLFAEKSQGIQDTIPEYKPSPIIVSEVSTEKSEIENELFEENSKSARKRGRRRSNSLPVQTTPLRKTRSGATENSRSSEEKNHVVEIKDEIDNQYRRGKRERSRPPARTLNLFGSDSDTNSKNDFNVKKSKGCSSKHTEKQLYLKETNKNPENESKSKTEKTNSSRSTIRSSHTSVKHTDYDKQKRKREHSKSKDILPKPTENNNILAWLNKDKIPDNNSKNRKNTESKSNPSKKSKLPSKDVDKHSTLSLTPKNRVILTEEERQLKREKHDKEMKAMNVFNEVVKSTLRTPKKVDTKTLNHLTVENVLSTFNKYEDILHNFFKDFQNQKSRTVPKIEGLDYMALQNFIPEGHILSMCSFLKDRYEPLDAVPQFTELYMRLLIPEWVLSVFMQVYDMNRQEALQQIIDQEESSILSTQMMDNSDFNLSMGKL